MESDTLTRRDVVEPDVADGERQLVVLIVLRDAARAERLSASLAMADDLLPVVASGGIADVAVIDDAVANSAAWVDRVRAGSATAPQVLLSVRAIRPQGQVFAVLPLAADATLIAAAVRLAAAGYRVSGDGRSTPDRHDDFDRGDAVSGVGDQGGLFGEESLDDAATPRPALSPREAEVLALLAEGAPNKVIARRLNISVHTAKFHVAAILIKLGAANRTDAIAIAMRQGLVLV
ncbi:helix-turn-helix transcriptional regulator [Mesorhizobium sp. PAMC28654]|uniref:helix-turn-helix transcriptional regulator n=1 Tax=Mesorhizobium sp. PAMC28654 TaxID=2880934 RepID=UPI001D0B2314|nr:helix-turn-helix transcriptional regulator [Mesorhizobium sp. PAMC28654]UDL88933.1 helix-turn-helix transcriptional regulator [Mesorhizobium sp. PAMC28654]